MNLKIILYVIVFCLSLVALDSLKIDNVFKKNKEVQAKILAFFLAMALSYLVVSFLYDVFLNAKII